ncbi:MAG: LPP20 family lipoprotein [Bacteroidota bacterium]
MNRFYFFIASIVASHLLFGQDYPRWFLFPRDVGCARSITIITQPPTFYRDSAISHGFRLGCDLLARYTMMQISGGQTFWATEAGIHSMGARYEQWYDTALTDVYQSTLKVIDSYIDKQKTLVLVGDKQCAVDDKARTMIRLDKIVQPRWVEQLPEDQQYIYAVGFSEEFYYEISSWQTAEKNAYMSLARSMHVKMQSMQKRDAIEAQDIRNEEINVTLMNVEILERWKDTKKKAFYTLARMKK